MTTSSALMLATDGRCLFQPPPTMESPVAPTVFVRRIMPYYVVAIVHTLAAPYIAARNDVRTTIDYVGGSPRVGRGDTIGGLPGVFVRSTPIRSPPPPSDLPPSLPLGL